MAVYFDLLFGVVYMLTVHLFPVYLLAFLFALYH